MATSIRKLRLPSVSIEVSERPMRSGKTKALSSAHSAPDRYSMAHLARILTSGERLAMLSAVDRLKGRVRVLVELAFFSSFQFVRLAAVSHLRQDKDALVEIAKYCHYSDTRSSVLDELSSDIECLIEVACSSLFRDTRIESVEMMGDIMALAEVASRSPYKDSRGAALGKVSSNSSALKKVAEESPYRASRQAAIKGVSSDVAALSALLLSSRHQDVKKAAASLLSGYMDDVFDPEAITELAKLSPNEDVRYLAVGRLSEDPWALRRVISESPYLDSKGTALMLLSDLVPKLDDAEILADVAILSPYQDCRTAAVERLSGQGTALASVAMKSKFKDSREVALVMLKGDVDSLKSVARLSKYQSTRKKAHEMIARPEVFGAELGRILG